MEVDVWGILVPRKGRFAWFNTDEWFYALEVINEWYHLFEPEVFGMELVPFMHIAVRAAYDPSAYIRKNFPFGAQDLGVVSNIISGELHQSTSRVVPGDWNSY